MGIFNGFGRLLWASLSDYIGRPLTCTILFVVNILMTISLIFLHAPALFTIAMAVLMTCYGAGFSLIPPYLSDIFGAKELATMHGYILTAWGMVTSRSNVACCHILSNQIIHKHSCHLHPTLSICASYYTLSKIKKRK